MLSSKKAFIVSFVSLLFANFTFAETGEKVLSQFPPAPYKFVREKRARKLILAEGETANATATEKANVTEKANANAQAFWRSKASIHRRMLEDRYIPVSVVKENLGDDLVSFDVKGAGIVHTSTQHAFRIAQEYNRLAQVSSNFKSVYYDEKNSQLFLVIEALGYETRMIMAIDLVTEKKRSEIQFEVVWGQLKGMTGAIGFEPSGDESCEVSILSHYQAKSFPLPKIFMGFAFEVVTQKIAEKMRIFIENEK